MKHRIYIKAQEKKCVKKTIKTIKIRSYLPYFVGNTVSSVIVFCVNVIT